MRLRKAARRVSQIYDHHLEATGLTITQFGVLASLVSADRVAIGPLAEQLCMDPTTLTRNLQPLHRQGLVVIEPDRRDRRVRWVSLSDTGRQAFDAARPAWREAQSHIRKLVGDDETATLHDALDHFLERIAE
ncbi:MAG TPA: MarR family winged helix-turn-helix transcriptional regulator [Hyphomicrobiaceae bacterium]|nr:MarR family winged helix-turn-helix transcriptional regulator [Hyphomicrobiaceae bacterium]